MAEINNAGNAGFDTYKATVDLVCSAVDLYAKRTGQSQETSDVLLFEIAKAIKMRPDGRAAKFLDHFLFGNGQSIEFGCAELVNDDVGVRGRITSEISKRLTANSHLRSRTVSGGDFVVAIRQSDFRVSDWKNAIGSFPIEWRVVDAQGSSQHGALGTSRLDPGWMDSGTSALTRHRAPSFLGDAKPPVPRWVTIYGANEYKWHPAANRVSQCIHQAGDRLTKSRIKSMNFWMIARPCTIDLESGLPRG